MKTKVYNLKGESVGETDLPDRIFMRPWNADLVYQAVITQQANRRKPWAHTKGRGEVSGGGRKPWKQKHTGRARHGSIRSPIWKGGGVAHGPIRERIYEKKINKKMLRAAIYSALSKRLADGELKVVDSLGLEIPRTKILASQLAVFLNNKISALLVPASGNKNIYRASSNIPKVKVLAAASLNVEDVLKYKNVLLDQKAITDIK